jgi:hypothetical protein
MIMMIRMILLVVPNIKRTVDTDNMYISMERKGCFSGGVSVSAFLSSVGV